ncbi:MAG TPA: hypothetical protein VNN79_24755 [Actinomycetota bacterium]|nr:hypothetical protein [Actinomycetota bacterium]
MGDHETVESVGAVEAGTNEGGGISRRGFIAGAAGGLTGVALSGVWRGAPARADTNEATSRSISNPQYAFLELEGTVVGSVGSFSGGNRFGEVVSDPPDPETGLVNKHVDGDGLEDIVVTVGLGMKQAMYDWISSFVDGNDPGHEGAVIVTDFNLTQKSRLEFQGYLHEVAFPELDAASKKAVAMTVKILPLSASQKTASGPVNGQKSNQALWLPANFRLDIDGVDSTHVNKIDAFAVTQELFDGIGGGKRRFTLPRPVVSDVGVQFPLSFQKTWTTYLNDFLDGTATETSGRLDVRNSSQTTILASIGFTNLGLFRLDPSPVPSGDSIRTTHAELYCEEVSFDFKPKP